MDLRWNRRVDRATLGRCIAALRDRLTQVHDKWEREYAAALAAAQEANDEAQRAFEPVPHENVMNAGAQVASSRARNCATVMSSEDVLAAWGGVERCSTVCVPPKDWRSVSEEEKLFANVVAAATPLSFRDDPLQVFKDHQLKLVEAVALDVLSVPSGEAPSERIFSMSTRVIGKVRGSMSTKQVCDLTFTKKNQRLLKSKK